MSEILEGLRDQLQSIFTKQESQSDYLNSLENELKKVGAELNTLDSRLQAITGQDQADRDTKQATEGYIRRSNILEVIELNRLDNQNSIDKKHLASLDLNEFSCLSCQHSVLWSKGQYHENVGVFCRVIHAELGIQKNCSEHKP